MDGKRKLIDKDALLRDLHNSKEILEIISANVHKDDKDEIGSRYCDYLCRIIGAACQIVEKQEEVQ